MKKAILIINLIAIMMFAVSCSGDENTESLNGAEGSSSEKTTEYPADAAVTETCVSDVPTPEETADVKPTEMPVPTSISDALDLPDIPQITEVPEKTDSTDIPDVEPAATEYPEVPTATEMPKITEVPETTEVPDITDKPEVNDGPDITGVPEITDEPEVTDKPEIIDGPEVTGPEKDAGDENSDEEEKNEVVVKWNPEWKYAGYSLIHDDTVTLYKAGKEKSKNITVAVNAGHGTSGGSSVKTYCHPDKTPKVTGGSTAEGALKATAVSYGSSTLSGTPEAEINLKLAKAVKEQLLEAGYDVLMIRESSDAQLDNIARTVFANNNADCHIALHFDSTETDKGFFFIGPPDISSYKKMEPVSEHWQEHNALGKAVVEGEKAAGVKIFGSGGMGMDLTQISYSTVPSIDVEVGDRASDYSDGSLAKIADGIVKGLDIYFKK